MLKDLLYIIIQNIRKRKLRSFLTLLGVIIGVAAIVGMIGAVQGISQSITSEISKFQSNVITILPGQLKFSFSSFNNFGAVQVSKLTDKDVDEIKKISGVRVVGGILSKRMTVDYNEESMIITVVGVEPEVLKETTELGLSEGRYFESNDGRVVIIGNSIANDLYKRNVELKKKLIINGEEFKVVGIFNKAGGVLQAIDTMIYMPLDIMRNDFSLQDVGFTQISVKLEDGADLKKITDEIDDLLTKLHRVKADEKDFTLITPEFTRQITGQITLLMQILMGGIASISLLVGGIGISNMMFTSVLERTREIGILKAIGATNKNIMLMFLMESAIIGVLGGIIGIIFGYGLGEGFLIIRDFVINQSGFTTITDTPHVVLTPQLVIGMLLFSSAVGVAAGYLPARRASKLQPVEALRYE